jgi:signal transduction histidine kinase
MKLRSKLAALSLLTLLLPWSGWKLLQELEGYLRETQEAALLASARAVTAGLPLRFRTQLAYLPDNYLRLLDLTRPPALDGYADDWPGGAPGHVFPGGGGAPSARVTAGRSGGSLYLFISVAEDRPGAAGLALLTRSPRGLRRFTIDPGAPGPLRLAGEAGGEGEGYWLDAGSGYRVELLLPAAGDDTDLAIGAARMTASPTWISLVPEWEDLAAWLADTAGVGNRAWLVDRAGRVLADSQGGMAAPGSAPRTTWLQRLAYRVVVGSQSDVVVLDEIPEVPLQLEDAAVRRALAGQEAIGWSVERDTAMTRGTAAVPVQVGERVAGAVVLQSGSEGLLLVTNRALGSLLFTTLGLALGLTAVLWYFATRLSRRVRRLSGAVSSAMDDRVDPESLPLRRDRDELGELARNNEKLLRAVADYSHYLQTLAGKLSHELKTPLAITRSSLDNLSSQPLDDESRRFLQRAQEGVERQAAIVRAMSEASRLEASIGTAEWQRIDLADLVRRSVEGYRAAWPGRRLELQLPATPLTLQCAPDLLAQALDKLVDNALSLSGPEDEVRIELRPVGEHCELAVRNTGTVLPQDFRDRLFDSLVSLRARRGSEPHLGLGLYIVRLVVAAHTGDVSARNLPGDGGVEFLIRLPRS